MAENTKNLDIEGNEIAYYGFPYITNIDSFVQSELAYRSAKRIRNISPFIKVTPGITTDGTPKGKIILKGIADEKNIPKSPPEYNFEDIYRRNRYMRPLPGIKSLSVSFKNKLGSVRHAQIDWVCHTIEDLELYSMYFMNPGQTIFIEWGWSPVGAEQVWSNDDPKIDFSNYFEETNKRVKKSRGNYDALLGLCVNFNWSMNNNGGFNCMTEVLSPGILLEGLTIRNQWTKGTLIENEDEQKESDEKIRMGVLDYIEDRLSVDLAHYSKLSEFTTDNENDYFILFDGEPKEVFYDTTDSTREKITKSPVYVSWGFVEDIIINNNIKIVDDNNRPLFGFDSRGSKIKSHPHLRTTDLSACIVPIKNNKKDADNNLYVPLFQGEINTEDGETGYEYGLVRRLLVNIEVVDHAFRTQDTIIDAVGYIFTQINNACINFWNFKIITLENYFDTSKNPDVNVNDESYPLIKHRVTDIDYTNRKMKSKETEYKAPYIFRTKGFHFYNENQTGYNIGNGVLKSIDFSSNLSNAAALQVYYSAHKGDNNIIGNNDNLYSLYKYYGDSSKLKDTFSKKYSINTGEAENSDAETAIRHENNTPEKEFDDEKLLDEMESFPRSMRYFLPIVQYGYDVTVEISVGKTTGQSTTNDDVDIEIVKYKKATGKEGMKFAVLTRPDGNDTSTATAIIPVKLALSLEGISGLRIGDVFSMDHLPSIYRERGLFHIIGLTQEINSSGWTTKIESGFRAVKLAESIYKSSSKPIYAPYDAATSTRARAHPTRLLDTASAEEIRSRIKTIFQDKSILGYSVSEKILEDAYIIVQRESNYDQYALNPNPPDESYGIFQINMYNGRYKLKDERTQPPFTTELGMTANDNPDNPYNLWDLDTNIKVAKYLFKRANYSWRDWTTQIYLDADRRNTSLKSEIS